MTLTAGRRSLRTRGEIILRSIRKDASRHRSTTMICTVSFARKRMNGTRISFTSGRRNFSSWEWHRLWGPMRTDGTCGKLSSITGTAAKEKPRRRRSRPTGNLTLKVAKWPSIVLGPVLSASTQLIWRKKISMRLFSGTK